ncbi:MAG: phosphoribosylformylglycinamidine synthase subunit PurS [Coriobacteriales bacterium]|jgi:phosphoribosylformylglycinamidine synthase|nr:phosphoribosylformylglycinamidine synthase subunit PurS [Coriobacteriales bacterium]
MKDFNIYVTAKAGIFDPAGAQAEGALHNLDLKMIEQVKIGKFIQLRCDDSTSLDNVRQACDKLLANPVIEDYRIEPVSED